VAKTPKPAAPKGAKATAKPAAATKSTKAIAKPVTKAAAPAKSVKAAPAPVVKAAKAAPKAAKVVAAAPKAAKPAKAAPAPVKATKAAKAAPAKKAPVRAAKATIETPAIIPVPKPEVIGIGIIGAGGIARGVHIPAYQALSNAKVIAVSDPFEAARNGAKEQFGIEAAYEDFREMLARDDIHAISVTTPNFLHAEATIAALEAGKHVLCEKPLAMDAVEGQAMVDAAQRTGNKLMCGYHFRFTSEIQCLKRFAESGEFGEMYYARTQALRRRGIPGWGLFISKEKNGGGPLIDIGVHMLDSTLHVLGFPKPIAVKGKTYQMFGKRSDVLGLMGQWDYENFTVEDFAVAHITFENGLTLTLESAFVANQEERDKMTFQIFGDQGGCQYNPLKMYTERNRTLLDITPVALPQVKSPHAEEIKSFVNSIVNDTPVFTPGEEALAVTKIIDAIYASSDSGEEIKLA
jgi:predicted dehydrogenase